MPEIRFTTNVQSLGREDVSAPGRLASAQIGAKDALVGGILQVERAAAAAQYTKQMSEARNSLSELYDSVISKESFMSSEIPEFVTGFERYEEVPGPDGGMIIQERRIPASEIREEWFRQGMLNITNAAVKGSTAPTARSRISTELRTSIGPAAYSQLLTYNRAAAKSERLAILDGAVQQGIVNGDRLGVEAVLERGRLTGEISQEDYRVRQLKASQDLDIESYTQDIFAAEDLSDLEEIEADLSLNLSPTTPGEVESDMTPAQRRSIRQSMNTKEAMLDEERDKRHIDNEQEGVVLALEGRLTDNWLIDMAVNDGLEGSALRALDNMRDTATGRSVVRNAVVSAYQNQIQKALYYPEFGQQVSNIAGDLRKSISRNDNLEGAEKVALFDYLTKAEKNIRDNPEYKTGLVTMRAAVGLPEDQAAFEALSFSMDPLAVLARKAYADFQKSMHLYIDEFGAEANVLEWIDKNKDRFNYLANAEERDNVKLKLENSRFKGYIANTPMFDSNLTMKRAYEDFVSGNNSVTEEDVFDIWNILYGDAIELQTLEGF